MRYSIPVSKMHHGKHIVALEIEPGHPDFLAEVTRRHARAMAMASRLRKLVDGSASAHWLRRASLHRDCFAIGLRS